MFVTILHVYRPVEVSTANDILCVEVWDFDPAETVKEKVTKVGDIKGFKGMKRFMKEIAVTATNGKHDNEIIGGTLIPLKVSIIIVTGIYYFNFYFYGVNASTFFSSYTDDTPARPNSLVQFGEKRQGQTAGEFIVKTFIRQRKKQTSGCSRTQAFVESVVNSPNERTKGNFF